MPENIIPTPPTPPPDDFEVTIEEQQPEPEKAAVLYLPNSEQAFVREALREKFRAEHVEDWFERWIYSGTSRAAFVVEELSEIIPPCFDWLVGCVDHDVLAREWEDCCRVVFATDRRGIVHAFAWIDFHDLDPRAKRKV